MVYAWVFLSMLSALKFYISYSQEPSIPFEGTPKFSNLKKNCNFWIKPSLIPKDGTQKHIFSLYALSQRYRFPKIEHEM